jgi:hypothetical protein
MAHSSAASAAWTWASIVRACDASGNAKSTRIAERYWQSIGLTFRSMMTLPHSTRVTMKRRTSSRGDSPAKTSALPESKQESSGASEAGYGENLHESFAWHDPVTSSWRTYQGCLFPAMESQRPLDEFLETWPRAGLMRNGRVFQLGLLVPLRPDGEFSLSPTLLASDHLRSGSLADCRRKSPPKSAVIVMHELTPTLRATETDQGDYQYSRGNHSKKTLTLKGVLKAMTPTLTASQSEKGPRKKATKAENGGHQVNLIDVTAHLSGAVGGVLNPTWCEWYMGFPVGWSEIESEHSETA